MAISDLIEQTIAQHIIAPRVLSYAPSKLNEVTGRFVSSNRVYNFVLNKSGVSYSPAGQGDSLLFSALYLRQDAVRKPKVGSDRCNAGKSYQCGKICLGNRRKCHKGVKDVNDARRIASILEGTNEKLKGSLEGSDKAKARGKALFEARKGSVEKPKAKPDDADALERLEQLYRLGRGEDFDLTSEQKYSQAQKKLQDLKYKSGDRIKRGTEVYYSMGYGDGAKELSLISGVVVGASKNGKIVSIKRTGEGDNEGKVYNAPIENLFKSLDAKKAYKEELEASREYYDKFESKKQAVKRRGLEVKERKEWIEENLRKKTYNSNEPPKKGATVYYGMDFGSPKKGRDSYTIIKGTVTGVSNNGQNVSIKRTDKVENEGKVYKAPTWQLFKSLDTQAVALEYEDLQDYVWNGTPIPKRKSQLIDKETLNKAKDTDLISQTARMRIKPINPTNVSTIVNTIKSSSTPKQKKEEYIEILKTALPKMRESKKFQGYNSVEKVEEILKQHTKN